LAERRSAKKREIDKDNLFYFESDKGDAVPSHHFTDDDVGSKWNALVLTSTYSVKETNNSVPERPECTRNPISAIKLP
jgi:hypothetical protein